MYWLLWHRSGVFVYMKRNCAIQVHQNIYELNSGIRLLYTLKYNKIIVQISLPQDLALLDLQLMCILYNIILYTEIEK